MAPSDHANGQAILERIYSLWEHAGRPEGRSFIHWQQALAIHANQRRGPDDGLEEEAEAVLIGDPHADRPALLAKDVPGG